jgi:oligopeptide transport system ATP-binding protein
MSLMLSELQEQKGTLPKEILLSARNVVKYFPVKGGLFDRVKAQVKAVDDVTFDIYKGETLGLVGESGCGKSTIAKTMLRIQTATSGTVEFEGRNIYSLSEKEMRSLRKNMQYIFQDPFSSLNPRLSVGQTISRVLKIHGMNNKAERQEKVQQLMEMVGLSPYHIRRYPHEFSGGQRQRIGIARALALNPKLVILDEPVSALDVSIQSQIINLLEDLQQQFNLTYLFVSHGLNVVRHISNRVGVMYLGKMVELSDTDTLFERPQHPYTQALLSSNPVADPRQRDVPKIVLEGDVPSPINPPSGCRFRTRCPYAAPKCAQEEPSFVETEPGRFVACHYPLS